MQKFGIESAILLVASLACFLFGSFAPGWTSIGWSMSAAFFAAACLVLAFMVIKRNKTKVG
jgi:hypothetical protein